MKLEAWAINSSTLVEDKGLLSVDVGMSSLHCDLGADIEVEMDNNNVEFDSGDTPEIMIKHQEIIEPLAPLSIPLQNLYSVWWMSRSR